MTRPILYSFRRCPYAIRARLGIAHSSVEVELREILLRDKAPEFLSVSDDATVPVLLLPNGERLQESVDILKWAWKDDISDVELELVAKNDGEFKTNLDSYKYASRHQEGKGDAARDAAMTFLNELDERLSGAEYLSGSVRGFADLAIAPFVRQFAHVDLDWFKSQDWPDLIRWYRAFVEWDGFAAVMQKYPKWVSGDPVTLFGAGDKPVSAV